MLAALPALPLDEAGKYVAAAYLIVFGMVLFYVAIMAARLGSLERDLAEINSALDRRGDTKAGTRAPVASPADTTSAAAAVAAAAARQDDA